MLTWEWNVLCFYYSRGLISQVCFRESNDKWATYSIGSQIHKVNIWGCIWTNKVKLSQQKENHNTFVILVSVFKRAEPSNSALQLKWTTKLRSLISATFVLSLLHSKATFLWNAFKQINFSPQKLDSRRIQTIIALNCYSDLFCKQVPKVNVRENREAKSSQPPAKYELLEIRK